MTIEEETYIKERRDEFKALLRLESAIKTIVIYWNYSQDREP